MRNITNKILRLIAMTPRCALFTLVMTGSLLAQKQLSFVAHREFVAIPTVGNPGKFAQGDLNGDGVDDLVIPEGDFLDATMHVAVVLGNPNGTFQPPVSFDTGATSNIGFTEFSVVIADFNGDGKNDVAVTTLDGVSILLGDGKGGLGVPRIFATGTLPFAMVAGDFNGDGKIDLAVANAGTNDVSILLGKGDSTFKLAHTLPVGLGPEGIAIGDFNGDGHPDLAVTDSNQVFANQGANGNTVAILLGTGNGFKPAVFIPVAAGPIGVAVADLNHDNKADIVVTNSGTDQVSVLLGKGDGTFQAPATFTVRSGPRPNDGYAPSYVVIDDFNGDGNPDLVVTSPNTSTAAILLGDGKGNLAKPTNLLVAAAPSAVVTGDYNHDGHRDFITVGNTSGTLSVFLGKGNGNFVVEPGFPVPTRADQIVVADFNEDGVLDVATANAGADSTLGTTVSVVLGKRGGGFAKENVIKTGENPLSFAVGDLNNDGHLDLVVANSAKQIGFQREPVDYSGQRRWNFPAAARN